jgi:predicted DNA-binding transcriptional regulator AlpA
MSKKSTSQLIIRIDGIAREAERRVITGVPTSSWYELQKKGLAPKPVRLGPRSVGWFRQVLFAWNEQRQHEDAWQSLGDAAARVVEKAGPR